MNIDRSMDTHTNRINTKFSTMFKIVKKLIFSDKNTIKQLKT